MIDGLEEKPKTTPVKECRVCSGVHDDEIHAATLAVHSWFKGYVTRYFAPEDLEQQFVA